MNIEAMKELLENGKYEEFVKQFPEDRKPRVRLASILAALVDISQGKRVKLVKNVNFASGGKPSAEMEIIKSKDGEREYLIVKFQAKFLCPNKESYGRRDSKIVNSVFFVGEDDSGFWIEYGPLHRGFNQSIDNEQEIWNRLSSGTAPKKEVEYFGSGNSDFVRIQGDINLGKVDGDLSRFSPYRLLLANRIFGIISKYIESVDKFSSAIDYCFQASTDEFLNFLLVDSRLETFKKLVYGDKENLEEAYKNCSSELISEFKYIDSVFSDLFILPGKQPTMLNFENHSIELYNTSYPLFDDIRARNVVQFIVIDKGKIVVKSLHHKTVSFELGRGVYNISKSGGDRIEFIESIMKYLGEYHLVENVYKKVNKEVNL